MLNQLTYSIDAILLVAIHAPSMYILHHFDAINSHRVAIHLCGHKAATPLTGKKRK